MSRNQKFAWFNLAVIAVTLIMFFSLLPYFGQRALGSLGCLGLIGVGPLFFRKGSGPVVFDERDALIQRRSWLFAYALFWAVFVFIAVVVSPFVYGEDGTVPVFVVRSSVFWGFMLVYASLSVAILVQYVGGSKHGE